MLGGLRGRVQVLSIAISLNILRTALPYLLRQDFPPEPDKLVMETKNRSHLCHRCPSRSCKGPGEERAGSQSRREGWGTDGVPTAHLGAHCLQTAAKVVDTKRKKKKKKQLANSPGADTGAVTNARRCSYTSNDLLAFGGMKGDKFAAPGMGRGLLQGEKL